MPSITTGSASVSINCSYAPPVGASGDSGTTSVSVTPYSTSDYPATSFKSPVGGNTTSSVTGGTTSSPAATVSEGAVSATSYSMATG